MSSRPPLLPVAAIVVLALLVVLWAVRPQPAREIAAVQRRPEIALLKDRPLPTLRPRGAEERSRGLPEARTREDAAGEAAARTEPRQTKRERLLARRLLRQMQRTTQPRASEKDVEVESGLPEDAIGGAPDLPPRPTLPPDSPYEGLTDEELLELVVGLKRLRDSGALRKLAPEDYLRIAELLPDNQGVQDADRIFRQVLGMGVGEWLSSSRGGDTFVLD